jgi:glyoxylase-like metal-dependent hydrolase (beta-lactamase superfamily II)
MRITDGVHRLGLGQINAYLLAEAGEVTIIDAGVPGLWNDLPAELAAMGRSLDDVRAIVLTHGHSDHIGFAERGRVERHWPVKVHEFDAALARGEIPNPAKMDGKKRIGAIASFAAYALTHGALRTKHLGEVATFGDGATLDVPGAPQVILVPGHTPGSAVLHVPSKGTLFVGDAIATYSVLSGDRGPMISPFTADAAMALESLGRLDGIEAAFVLPGHGEPWTDGIAVAIERIRASGS